MTDRKAQTPRCAPKPAAEASQSARLTCRTCRFWKHPVWDLDEAMIPVKVDCHRRAPIACDTGHGGIEVDTAWPRTVADDWCGEAEPVDDALAAERAEARKRFENSPFADIGVRNRPRRGR